MSPEAVLGQVEETRQRWWLFSLLCGLLLAAFVGGASFICIALLDVLIQFSRVWLGVLFTLWASVSLALVVWAIRRAVRYQRSLAAAARRIEAAFPELGSSLINLVQLSSSANGAPEGFRKAAVADAAAWASQVPLHQAAAKETRWGRLRMGIQTPRDLLEHCGALVTLLLVAYVLNMLLPQWSSATERLFHPWKFVPQVGSLKIVEVVPGEAQVLIGTSLDVMARIENPKGKRYRATLYTKPEDGPESAQTMLADASGQRYTFTIPAVTKPIQYRIEIGDSQTPYYAVRVVQKPAIEQVEVSYKYPSYLGRPADTIRQRHADLEAPQYTEAVVRFRASTTLSKGYVEVAGRKSTGTLESDRRTLVVRQLITKPATYTVHLFNEAGHTDPNPRVNHIRVIEDKPPSVQIAKPGREVSVAPGGKVNVVVRASDDYGLGSVRLEWKLADQQEGEQSTHTARQWRQVAGSTTATLTHALPIDSERFKPGQELLVRAVAVDQRQFEGWGIRLQPQQAASQWHRIRVVSPDAQAQQRLANLDGIRAKLWAILRTQLSARVLAAQAAKQEALDKALGMVRDVGERQVQVQTASVELVDAIDPELSEEHATIRRALSKLAHGDMIEAVRQAERTERVKELAALAKPLGTLTGTQDRIIDVLRRLLDTVRAATADTLAQMQERPGGDLPDDVQDKLRDLKKKLDEFLEQQKRVIEASENLAKKPVEDFTEEEKQLLKDLAATEDDWSRFMGETHSDLSKLPEQDFANPTMLQELVEVQTELKMAEGALTKKTADIAVPLEQLGAEMAEEIVTNIEKWLPDTPDRERWSQEEPLTDEMKEAPMAELPGELEDLVGELMEEEEDLFDEMEDISSSWADSLDKGAGWDAADGPISNMSAKGVTGNRLPNTSEIGGRSGEGRQGKSSGEFVSDTAVGKGGRKTPTRLTPDPYVKGQVKDYSKDPVGGATGGGKESGQGGEGLEGPVPNRPQRQMQRLAGKQAALRNKAEGIDLRFQVLNYHHADLKKLIQMMAAVEADLRAGRYHSALRRREVMLKGLGNIKTYLEGEFQIRQDQTSNVPAEIQKEILSSMQEGSPVGWEELNRKYFERLTAGDKAAGGE